jgi:transcriptional regulator with XRE-family HTH domain
MSKFSDNFKALRVRHNFTQQELAKKLGVSKSTISMYENGNRTPDFETLEAIADLFNVSIDSILGTHNNAVPEIITIAAHAVGDLSQESIEKIIAYAKFIKSQENESK